MTRSQGSNNYLYYGATTNTVSGSNNMLARIFWGELLFRMVLTRVPQFATANNTIPGSNNVACVTVPGQMSGSNSVNCPPPCSNLPCVFNNPSSPWCWAMGQLYAATGGVPSNPPDDPYAAAGTWQNAYGWGKAAMGGSVATSTLCTNPADPVQERPFGGFWGVVCNAATQCPNMVLLDGNGLAGALPPSMAVFTGLTYMNMQNNALSGCGARTRAFRDRAAVRESSRMRPPPFPPRYPG